MPFVKISFLVLGIETAFYCTEWSSDLIAPVICFTYYSKQVDMCVYNLIRITTFN